MPSPPDSPATSAPEEPPAPVHYCPNCSAPLETPDELLACWNCEADFGPGSAWRPADTPTGHFRVFRKRRPRLDFGTYDDDNPHPVLSVILRSLGRAVLVVVPGSFVLAYLPPGAQAGPWRVSLLVAALVLSAWALLPLRRLFKRRRRGIARGRPARGSGPEPQ